MSETGLPLMGDTADIAVWTESAHRLKSFKLIS